MNVHINECVIILLWNLIIVTVVCLVFKHFNLDYCRYTNIKFTLRYVCRSYKYLENLEVKS